ncbi:MAG: tyrosine-type recombinase/integrase [Lachnospiraceae bacterium]|jgi:integrase|nr:tyrosine-type recombinase/integrase [Lachnospiraceae bacterium]MDE7000921.1 tyrosine-type recombinase/integrase [Lachnospiraceae bacterium]
MKLPNGYGSVTKLSGNRRKPYLARVTLGWITDEQTGKTVQNRVPIGTYKTKKEALQALAEYGSNPYDIQSNNLTLSELYQKWTETYFPTLESDSSIRTITSAWKYCHALYSIRVKDLRARHIKGVMENGYIIPANGKDAGQKVYASPGTKARIKSMFNLMLDYALEYELVDKNYARTFDLSNDIIKEKEEATRGHIIFTDVEMQTLWDNVDSLRFVDWILIQCYMGWRPQELARLKIADVNLNDQYIVGGMKTSAGKNRTVPIHPRIKHLVQRNYDQAVELGSKNLFNDPLAVKGGLLITYDKYAGRFAKIMTALNFREDHRPHDPRKTFITMAKKAQVDEYVIKRLIGHRITDLTEGTYTERDIEWLRTELEKMP